jgi:hypothetical protein
LTNAHEVLGVAHNAPMDVVKRAFKKLVRLHHPDLHPHVAGASDRLKLINAAYAEISGKRIASPRRPRKRADLDWGGCEVAGRTGETKKVWGFVVRVDRRGAGLYDVHLDRAVKVEAASVDVVGHAFPSIDYQQGRIVRLSLRSRVSFKTHADADFTLNLGAKL